LDIPLLIIGTLLAGTVTAFLLGIFPYPFGIIVLSAFFIVRLMTLKQNK
jgi:dihydroxy-acid dehydratase